MIQSASTASSIRIVCSAIGRPCSRSPELNATSPQQCWSAGNAHLASAGAQDVDDRLAHLRQQAVRQTAGKEGDPQAPATLLLGKRTVSAVKTPFRRTRSRNGRVAGAVNMRPSVSSAWPGMRRMTRSPSATSADARAASPTARPPDFGSLHCARPNALPAGMPNSSVTT